MISMPFRAIRRAVSPSLNDCQLGFVERLPIDIAKAIMQHEQYEVGLRSLGIAVFSLPDLRMPSFVEDPMRWRL